MKKKSAFSKNRSFTEEHLLASGDPNSFGNIAQEFGYIESRDLSLALKEQKKIYGRIKGCERCGRKRGLIRAYGLHMCRQCFREKAEEMGFKKYS